MDLRPFDPPAARTSDVVTLLDSIHGDLQGWILPRVLNPYWLDSEGRTAQEATVDDPGQAATPPA